MGRIDLENTKLGSFFQGLACVGDYVKLQHQVGQQDKTPDFMMFTS